jgi:hypothetical protein
MSTPVRTRLKDKAPQTQRTQKAIVIANGIAAACMFLSWLAQNVYQSELGSTKSKIESDAGFVNSEMTNAIQWMLTFQTDRKKDKPDTEIILNSAIGIC